MDLPTRTRLEHYYARVLPSVLADTDGHLSRVDRGRALQRKPFPWPAPAQDLEFRARLRLMPSPAAAEAVHETTNVRRLRRRA
jgi:hypothetical protein